MEKYLKTAGLKLLRNRENVALTLICGVECTVTVFGFGASWHSLRMCILFPLLLGAAVSDLYTMEIPDEISLAIVWVFAVFLPLESEGTPWLLERGLWGFFGIGAMLLAISGLCEMIMGQEVMGGGDIKLFAALGLHLGFVNCLFLIAVSCIVGMVYSVFRAVSRKVPIPFAPPIAVGMFITVMMGERFIELYKGLLTP